MNAKHETLTNILATLDKTQHQLATQTSATELNASTRKSNHVQGEVVVNMSKKIETFGLHRKECCTKSGGYMSTLQSANRQCIDSEAAKSGGYKIWRLNIMSIHDSGGPRRATPWTTSPAGANRQCIVGLHEVLREQKARPTK